MPQKVRFDHQEALRLLNEGKSKTEVAKKMGVSLPSIYNLVNKEKPKDKTLNIEMGGIIYLRGKKFSVSEVIKALSISKIFENLTEEQVNDICYRIVENAIKAPQLDKQLKEIKSKYESVSNQEQRTKRELDKYKSRSVKERIIQLDAAVLHGD